ncbi:MAG: hypothetical protein AB8H80_14895 [Planctomycetota bacterium]
MSVRRLGGLLLAAICMLVPTTSLSAQIGGDDPKKEIQEIAEAIDKQLKEIDRLLLESGKKGQSRAKPKEMLEQAAEGTKVVEDGIDKLIEKLEDMKNQSSSSSSSSSSDQQSKGQGQDSQSQPQSGQQQGSSDKQRRENQTPNFVDQGEQQSGQQENGQQPNGQQPNGQQQQPGQNKPGEGQDQKPQPKPGEGQPQGGQQASTAGQNTSKGKAQNGETGPGKRGTGQGEWGELQPYLNFLKNRGSSPKVPPRFRKYYEAFLKNKQKGKK